MKPPSIGAPDYVKAMSHPLRVRILGALTLRTSSPRQLADNLQASVGVVSYHVRTLERLGLIELVKETRVRGAVEHHYRARPRPQVSEAAWAHATSIAEQTAAGSSLQLIGELAFVSAGAGGFDRGDAILSRRSMRLDARGFVALARLLARTLKEVDRMENEAAERIRRDRRAEDRVEVGMVLLLFEAVSLSGDGPRTSGPRPRHAAARSLELRPAPA